MGKSKNDIIILQLKKQIEAQKKVVESGKTKHTPKTNLSLFLFGTRYNLHVIDKETCKFLIGNIEALRKGLGVHIPEDELIVEGYKASYWIEDLLNRYMSLNVKHEEARLSALETKLNSLLSNEVRVELELEDILKSFHAQTKV